MDLAKMKDHSVNVKGEQKEIFKNSNKMKTNM